MTSAEVSALVPHAGSMCLLDRVLEHSEGTVRCAAVSHRAADHPLRHDGRLAALHLAEYAAQAMAVHGALIADGRARPGMLAALRDIRLHVERIDDIEGELVIEARRRIAQSDGSLYEFEVHGGGRPLAQGRISIAFF